MNWLKKPSTNDMSKLIFEYFKMAFYRIKSEDIILFICEVINNNYSRFYENCFELISMIELSSLQHDYRKKIKQCLMDVTIEDNKHILGQSYSLAILRFCKTSGMQIDDLEASIRAILPNYYNDTYLIEMTAERGGDISEFIKSNLSSVLSQNKTQGVNGTYEEYAVDNLMTIYNVIALSKPNQYSHLLDDIVNVIIDTLSSENQTVKAKKSAWMLLLLLYLQEPSANIWSPLKQQLIDNSSVYSTGCMAGFFAKDTNYILDFQYNLFISCFDNSNSEILIEKTLLFNSSSSYTQIQILKIIDAFLMQLDEKYDNEKILLAFLCFSISMSQIKEHDVNYIATKCLIELTKFNISKRTSLIHLSLIMDQGSQDSKILILKKINSIYANESAYKNNIIDRAKADSNHLVRFVVQRIDKENK